MGTYPSTSRGWGAVAWCMLSVTAFALATIAAMFGGTGWLAHPASAHSGYERSEPADGAVLADSPPRVDVYFSQEMARSGGLPTLIVVNDSGDQVDLGATLDDNDRTHLYAELAPSLPNGRYTVIWHTLSDEDGEEAQGAFHFYVGAGPAGGTQPPATPPAGATPSPQPTVAPSPQPPTTGTDDGGIPAWALVLGIAGGALAGGVGGIFAGRRLER